MKAHYYVLPESKHIRSYSSAARCPAGVWQAYLNHGSSIEWLSHDEYAPSYEKKDGVYYDVVVDGTKSWGARIWVRSGSTIEETMKELFGDSAKEPSAGIVWKVTKKRIGKAATDKEHVLIEVFTTDYRKSMETIDCDVGCEDAVGSDAVEATIHNGIEVPEMRTRYRRHVGAECGYDVGEHHDDVGCDAILRKFRVVPAGHRVARLRKTTTTRETTRYSERRMPGLMGIGEENSCECSCARLVEIGSEKDCCCSTSQKSAVGACAQCTCPEVVAIDSDSDCECCGNENDSAKLPGLININEKMSMKPQHSNAKPHHATVSKKANASPPGLVSLDSKSKGDSMPGLVSIDGYNRTSSVGCHMERTDSDYAMAVIRRCHERGIMPWKDGPVLFMLPKERVANERFNIAGKWYTLRGMLKQYNDTEFELYAKRSFGRLPKTMRGVKSLFSTPAPLSIKMEDKTTDLRFDVVLKEPDIVIGGAGMSRSHIDDVWEHPTIPNVYVLELHEIIH